MELLMTLGLLFIIGAAVLLTSRRIGVPAIPGLIIAGLLVSQFYDVGNISEIIVLGISFLVFYIGLRTDLDGFRKVSSDSLNVSLVQVLLTFALLYPIANFLGFQVLESLYIALAGSMASTLAGTDIFDESLRMDLHHGQISTASNFIQDIIAVIVIAALAAGISTQGLQAGLISGGLLLLAFIFREIFSKRFHGFVGSEELKAVTMVAVFAASVGLAQQIGISVIALAFAGGLMFSRGSETEEFLDVLEPLKDFFSVILFTGLGALLTVPSFTVLQISMIIILGALVFRPLIVSLVMLVDGHGARKSFKTSSNMLQVSEFALAAVIIAWISGTVDRTVLEAAVLSTAFTMIFAAFMVKHTDRVYEKFGRPLREIEEFLEYRVEETTLENHVIVIGYDERGRKVVEQLQEEGREFVVIDFNIENIERARIENIEHIFGDVLEDQVLQSANLEKADLVICTSDHRPVIDKVKSLNIRKLLMVEEREMAETLESEDTEVIIESAMIEKGLKQKVKSLILEAKE